MYRVGFWLQARAREARPTYGQVSRHEVPDRSIVRGKSRYNEPEGVADVAENGSLEEMFGRRGSIGAFGCKDGA
jgi:hypothetical protein